MRIPLLCSRCTDQAHAEIEDDDVLIGQCPNGHTVRIWSDRLAYHTLLDVGALALFDGYRREAVLNFAGAIECAIALYVEVSLVQSGVDYARVKSMLRSNKRDQLRIGMVHSLFLRDTGDKFQYLPDERVKFRNEVVHNAEWPSEADTMDYAEYACRAVLGVESSLGARLDAYLKARAGRIRAEQDLLPPGERAEEFPGWLDFKLLEFVRDSVGDGTFKGALATFRQMGPWAGVRRVK